MIRYDLGYATAENEYKEEVKVLFLEIVFNDNATCIMMKFAPTYDEIAIKFNFKNSNYLNEYEFEIVKKFFEIFKKNKGEANIMEELEKIL